AKPDLIMHAALTTGDDLLMGADDPSGGFNGNVSGMCVNYSVADAGDAKKVFDALADGRTVQMAMAETFYSPAFGMRTDRYGTPWMIMADMPAGQRWSFTTSFVRTDAARVQPRCRAEPGRNRTTNGRRSLRGSIHRSRCRSARALLRS